MAGLVIAASLGLSGCASRQVEVSQKYSCPNPECSKHDDYRGKCVLYSEEEGLGGPRVWLWGGN